MKTLLKTEYYDVPVASETFLTRDKKLLRKVVNRKNPVKPVKPRDVDKFMQNQDPYTLHHKVVRKFKRNHYYAHNIDHIWECDLCDMSMLAKTNDGHKYLFTCIDVLSKHAWVEPMRDKQAATTVQAFRNILQRSHPRKPLLLRSDWGSEFKNKSFRGYLNAKNIQQQFPQTTSLFKCAVVEVFNKSLRNRIYRYFTSRGPSYTRYIDVLADIVRAYNGTVHSTIGMRPHDVKPTDVPAIYARTHRKHHDELRLLDATRAKFVVGDRVRVIKKPTSFVAGYQEKWRREVFVVAKCLTKAPYRLYQLKDTKNVPIDGKFYAQELQKVGEPPKPQIHPWFVRQPPKQHHQ